MARRTASALARIAVLLVPSHLGTWARAMASEIAFIRDDRAALFFAAGCVRAALGFAVNDLLSSRKRRMSALAASPRLLGLLTALVAVGLGAAYLTLAGAPASYPVVNVAAFVIGLGVWFGLARVRGVDRWSGPVLLAVAIALLGTSLFGLSVDGATRWIALGSLSVQSSLLLLPAALVLHARTPSGVGAAAAGLAAVALAIQPDRAMAGMLVAGLAVPALHVGRVARLALAAAVAGFGIALLRPEVQPASRFVDQILFTAFDVHPAAGVAVVAGCLLLLLPASLARGAAGKDRDAMLVFGAIWLAVIAAAALGNFPTPLVGYGGSAVLGYMLSVAVLPARVSRADAGPGATASPAELGQENAPATPSVNTSLKLA